MRRRQIRQGTHILTIFQASETRQLMRTQAAKKTRPEQHWIRRPCSTAECYRWTESSKEWSKWIIWISMNTILCTATTTRSFNSNRVQARLLLWVLDLPTGLEERQIVTGNGHNTMVKELVHLLDSRDPHQLCTEAWDMVTAEMQASPASFQPTSRVQACCLDQACPLNTISTKWISSAWTTWARSTWRWINSSPLWDAATRSTSARLVRYSRVRRRPSRIENFSRVKDYRTKILRASRGAKYEPERECLRANSTYSILIWWVKPNSNKPS